MCRSIPDGSPIRSGICEMPDGPTDPAPKKKMKSSVVRVVMIVGRLGLQNEVGVSLAGAGEGSSLSLAHSTVEVNVLTGSSMSLGSFVSDPTSCSSVSSSSVGGGLCRLVLFLSGFIG